MKKHVFIANDSSRNLYSTETLKDKEICLVSNLLKHDWHQPGNILYPPFRLLKLIKDVHHFVSLSTFFQFYFNFGHLMSWKEYLSINELVNIKIVRNE